MLPHGPAKENGSVDGQLNSRSLALLLAGSRATTFHCGALRVHIGTLRRLVSTALKDFGKRPNASRFEITVVLVPSTLVGGAHDQPLRPHEGFGSSEARILTGFARAVRSKKYVGWLRFSASIPDRDLAAVHATILADAMYKAKSRSPRTFSICTTATDLPKASTKRERIRRRRPSLADFGSQ